MARGKRDEGGEEQSSLTGATDAPSSLSAEEIHALSQVDLPDLGPEEMAALAMMTGCDQEVDDNEDHNEDHDLHRWEGEGGLIAERDGPPPGAAVLHSHAGVPDPPSWNDRIVPLVGAGVRQGLTEDDRPAFPGLTLTMAAAAFQALHCPNGFYEYFGVVAERVAADQVILSLATHDPVGGGVGHFRFHCKLPALLPVEYVELRGTAEADPRVFER